MVSYLSPGGLRHPYVACCSFVSACLAQVCSTLLMNSCVRHQPSLSSRLHTVSNHLMSACHTHLWVFIVLLLTSHHLIPRHGAFSHADQDMDVVGILMRSWGDGGKLQTAVYTTRNFSVPASKCSLQLIVFEPGGFVYHFGETALCFSCMLSVTCVRYFSGF